MEHPMKIALIGYGKMGKAIEAAGRQAGHSFPLIIDLSNQQELTAASLSQVDVAIEFTGPHSAADNITTCLDAGIPIVSGSTGWLDQWEKVSAHCHAKQGCLIYSSNFSIGVNLFFAANVWLAKLMKAYPNYRPSIEEIHHTEKKDAPSGTAITLAEDLLAARPDLSAWINEPSTTPELLPIISKRIDPTPGTHRIQYSSPIDDIELIHTAHNRTGFANGALLAAAFTQNKRGIFSMREVIGF
jgi:4-hydroxy-tetrahydrodipicolinate reductase